MSFLINIYYKLLPIVYTALTIPKAVPTVLSDTHNGTHGHITVAYKE